MSKIGKKPIPIPKGVDVSFKNGILSVKGPKGEMSQRINSLITPVIDGDTLIMKRKGDDRTSRAFHGLYRSLANNMITGVSEGFERKLEVIGVGYNAELVGKGLMLNLGYSHSIFIAPPDAITIEVNKPKTKTEAQGALNQYLIAVISVKGIDKQLVGQVAAKIRSFRKPDPYKSKGIRYFGERISLKAGKTATGAA